MRTSLPSIIANTCSRSLHDALPICSTSEVAVCSSLAWASSRLQALNCCSRSTPGWLSLRARVSPSFRSDEACDRGCGSSRLYETRSSHRCRTCPLLVVRGRGIRPASAERIARRPKRVSVRSSPARRIGHRLKLRKPFRKDGEDFGSSIPGTSGLDGLDCLLQYLFSIGDWENPRSRVRRRRVG